MVLIKMIQTSKNRWKLISEAGVVILDDIILGTEYDAKVFAENYISSFQNWRVCVIPIKR